MFLWVLEFSVISLIFVGMLTQVIVPIYRSTILFPFFRYKARAVEQLRAEAQEEIEVAEVEQETEILKEKVKKIRPKKVKNEE